MFKVVSDIWNAHCTRNWLVITYYILARVLLIISTYYVYAYALSNNQFSSSIVRRRQHSQHRGGSQEIRQLGVRSQESSLFPQGHYYVLSYALSFRHFYPNPKKCTHGTKIQQQQQQPDRRTAIAKGKRAKVFEPQK